MEQPTGTPKVDAADHLINPKTTVEPVLEIAQSEPLDTGQFDNLGDIEGFLRFMAAELGFIKVILRNPETGAINTINMQVYEEYDWDSDAYGGLDI